MVQKATKHSVSPVKVALSDEVQEAINAAIGRYISNGGDVVNTTATIAIVVSDVNGAAGAFVSEKIDLDDHQRDYVTFIRDDQTPVKVELSANPLDHGVGQKWRIGDLLKEAKISLAEDERIFDEDENIAAFKLEDEIDWQWAGGELFIRVPRPADRIED